MAITDIPARNAKPKERKIKLSDGDNLYLLISPVAVSYTHLRAHETF